MYRIRTACPDFWAPGNLMFLIRSAHPHDLQELAALAQHLDTLNLPHDAPALESIIDLSVRSFRGEVAADSARYLFVLCDPHTSQVLGSSMLIAAHGTPHDPHHFLRVDSVQRYSSSLRTLFRHRILQFRQSWTPHTELGALVLHPALRGHPARLGRLLSYARFLYLGAHPERFCAEVQAELLPPFREDGSSVLWDWLGRQFTGLDYQHADRLSRTNHEFMQSLFPSEPIHIALMPADVQAVIGAVGPATQGVAHLLQQQGFRPNGHIDPFDGGPHFAAATKDIPIASHTRRREVAPHPHAEKGVSGLVGREDSHGHWRIVETSLVTDAEGYLCLDPATRDTLQVTDRDPVYAAPLR